MQNRYIQLFICYVLLVVKLDAGVTVTGAVTGTRVVSGYFNENNEVTITITLDGNEVSGGSNDLSNTRIMVHFGYNSTNTVNTIATALRGNLGGFDATKCLTDNVHVYTLVLADLSNLMGGSPEGQFFDFTIRFWPGSPAGNDAWVDTDNDGIADVDAISVSSSVADNAALTITGALASAGSVDFGNDSGIKNGRIITITSAGNDAGMSFVVTGTDISGNAQTETITGANAGTATGTKYFNTVTGIQAQGNPAGNVQAGVNNKKADKDDIIAGDFPSAEPLEYDTDAPGLSVTVPSSDGAYFKDKEFTYTVDEDLLTHSGATPWQSTKTITGDANGNGLDNGETYVQNISGSLLTDSPITTDVSGIFSPAVGDGSGYDLVFSVYDKAGNVYNATRRYNIIYDATPPTISEITTTENPTTGTKKLNDNVQFTINFSEKVTADGTMTVTLTSTNTAATATVTSSNIDESLTADVTYQVATNNESDHLNISGIEMASGKFLTDEAGHQMSVFTFSGNN